MTVRRVLALLAVAALATFAPASALPEAAPRITVMGVPDPGIQPQAVSDPSGTVHLLFFKGEPAHGDLFYARLSRAATSFGPAVRVNSDAGSAIATGSVRGGRIAVGRNGWIHVVWNGSTPVERGGGKDNPMWYARISPSGVVEPQRAIGTHTRHLDGGGSVSADVKGNVAVVWHAAGDTDGEEHRRIYVARSADDGARFAPESSFGMEGGNCGCCRIDSLLDSQGRLQILYRRASGGVHRDAAWITVEAGKATTPTTLQAWELPACPMTTFAMAESKQGLVAAWETAQQIYTAAIDPSTRQLSPPTTMQGAAIRKHPAIAINAAGDRLYAWTEGTAWARGGALAWELRAADGRRLSSAANAGAVPVWGLVTAVARPDGSFLILH